MKPSPQVFREYDVRGIAGEQLTAELAEGLGRAVGTFVLRGGGRQLVVGRDHRLSGPELCAALARGIAATGCDVVDIGITPTPVGYWTIQNIGADGGVQVTGSHNPPEYNGFKMTLLGRSCFGDDIQGFYQAIIAEDYVSGSGALSTRAVLNDYVADLGATLRAPARPFKVVVDAGNGTGGLTAVPLYEQLGYDVVPLHCTPDGTFPHHHPDPTVEANLADLRDAVAAHGADLGIALDGDADRLGIIDRDGEIVRGDRVMIILARELLREQPGAAIIGEVKCSTTLYDAIRDAGGEPVMWRTGHSLIKAKMKEIAAPLAGEMSGHIFYAHRYYGFDDAVYAGARLMEILAAGESSIRERLADLPDTVATPEIRVDCDDATKFPIVDAVGASYRERATREGFVVIDIDGVRVEWPDGWGLVRPSNTQPILVMRFEAENATRLAQIQKDVEMECERARAAVNR